MTYEQYANKAQTTLNGGIDNVVTSLTLTSATGFPAAPFRILIDNEIILVGARSGTSCTSLTRGAEGTTGASHSDLATITHILTSGSLLALAARFSIRTTYAARPAAGLAGRYWVQSDGPLSAFDDGSVWHEYFGSFPLTTPVSGDFAWVNQGSASVDTTYGGILLAAPADGTQSWRIRKKSAPSTPYHIEALILPHIAGAAYPQSGIGFRESGTGKLIFLKMRGDGGNMFVTYSASETSESSNLANPLPHNTPYVFFRIGADGTNITFDFSWSGVPGSWVQIFSEAKAVHFTTAPDEVLFAVDPRNASFAARTYLLSWKETS